MANMTTTPNDINVAAPKQFAFIDGNNTFHREFEPIDSRKKMQAFVDKMSYRAAYESVYGFRRWDNGRPVPNTAVINCIYLDFDDVDDPGRAMMDAAEVAWYVGHTTQWFSGKKGVGMLIHFPEVELIPDLKSAVVRRFVDELSDRLPELDTLDYAVVGDLNRVHRIIGTRHQMTRFYAIGLTARELTEFSIDDVYDRATKPRRLAQNPSSLEWVAQRLHEIEDALLIERLDELYVKGRISNNTYRNTRNRFKIATSTERHETYLSVKKLENEWHRALKKNAPQSNGVVGSSPEETWLLKAEAEFKRTGRAANGSRQREHKARCHLVYLAKDLHWDENRVCEIFTGADDYDRKITERHVRSIYRRR